ncbi:DNA alkylation repair protein [Anaerobacillus alkalilacustris]|uniref:DNA alkylation repair protein n=1 Tax=Anaerobacillus alkalilacustris TaxID=393763 RepID=A0A1S2LLP1_9BACI|nr:DNA alkylation repair protein [Anaerobacillus alkalilacustris]OIJ13422.1 DNA alkylation repair protein [Anaerobacillus alkalilacustris]
MTSYRCPTCKARSRFNIIDQVVTSVKLDTATGNYVQLENTEPYHLKYHGPDKRIQCASCGLVEDENRFIKAALL